MRHANLLSDTVLNFLYSLWGNPYASLFSVTPDFLESCREHTNKKMIGLDGKTTKATANLADQTQPCIACRTSTQWFSGT